MDETLIKIIKKVDSHMQLYYHIPLYMMDITNSKGYWQDKNVCDPATCASPLHGCIGCGDGIRHTMTYTDHYRGAGGKFVSQYSSWTAIKQATDEGILTDEIIKQIIDGVKIE